MSRKNKDQAYTRHSEYMFPDGLTDAMLVDLYQVYQPVGSGPLGTMAALCAMIEEVAKIRGIELPPAKGRQITK